MKTYEKAVRKLIDLSTLDLSAAEVDQMIEAAEAEGKTPAQCASDLAEYQDEEQADRYMIGCHN